MNDKPQTLGFTIIDGQLCPVISVGDRTLSCLPPLEGGRKFSALVQCSEITIKQKQKQSNIQKQKKENIYTSGDEFDWHTAHSIDNLPVYGITYCVTFCLPSAPQYGGGVRGKFKLKGNSACHNKLSYVGLSPVNFCNSWLQLVH